jgi:hypothetical protein
MIPGGIAAEAGLPDAPIHSPFRTGKGVRSSYALHTIPIVPGQKIVSFEESHGAQQGVAGQLPTRYASTVESL